MFGLTTNQKKKKSSHPIDVNPVEAIRDFGGAAGDFGSNIGKFGKDVAESVNHDLAQKGAEDFWKQVIGKYEEEHGGSEHDLEEGQEMDLSAHHEKKADIAPALDYHREMKYSGERGNSRERQEIEAKIEQILVELEMLIDSSSDLESKFEFMAVETKPVEPGTYHINFFDFIIKIIQEARQQIEDSGSWLQALQSKKGQRSYWAMFKKHGTTFGMSNERQVATQAG